MKDAYRETGLMLFDWAKQVFVNTDASAYAIGQEDAQG